MDVRKGKKQEAERGRRQDEDGKEGEGGERPTSMSVAKTIIDPGLNSSGITISAYSPLSFFPTLISGVSISINSDGIPLNVEVDSLN
jgi:hypothetical protein